MEKLGLEMEMVVAHRDTGRSHTVENYFDALAGIKRGRGLAPSIHTMAGRAVAVLCEGCESGLDNAFNHLESALGPVAGGPGGLAVLESTVLAELADVIDALESDQAVLLNAAEHPDCPLDTAFYRRARAPKPIYDYWVDYRGWQHQVGIDAKAQNGPTTSVTLGEAANALNVMLALAPAFIALFANSPLEGGQITGLKENRLSIWPRMFAASRFACDARLSSPPDVPFDDLGAYFRWAYGAGTVMHTVPLVCTHDYKGQAHTARVHADPSLLDFLAMPQARATACDTGQALSLQPSAAHFEYLQFSPFLDARFRFRFGTLPSLKELLACLDKRDGIEQLMARVGTQGYIEGRVPGANFPDAGLLDELGKGDAASVVMAPSALQAGLLNNLAQARQLVDAWGWQRLLSLRSAAITHALDDASVHGLVGEVIAVAQAGLRADEQRHLAYARWVWANRRTGADRMLETWQGLAGPSGQRLSTLARQRRVVHPRHWAPSAS